MTDGGVNAWMVAVGSVAIVRTVSWIFGIMNRIVYAFWQNYRIGQQLTAIVCTLLLLLLLLFGTFLRLLLRLLRAFPFHTSILEPDFHLRLGEHEATGHFETLRAG